MKEHFKKYSTIYLIIFIVICTILSITFIYLGQKYKEAPYTETEAIGIMKLKADTLTRIMEIGATEGACDVSDPTTLSEEEMDTYGFDTNLYKKVVYTMSCKDNKQIVSISITGTGDFNGFELKDYISNNNKKEEES